ncbi:CPBP family intramembrane glutamic endopeptidase [Clostridium scatologenes]|uniref:CAAX prenyl protease 2/Lysostaphin resistance protein A-like domain-containing protein n=1 Tax=Clostridium scatologenes TaxID=1548 RepID=A0A0E3M915_CLOSL|nr:type II CAAX endopeptidase family protein [Clostridium scatologenes]AKA72409.1 hypothetical protein CSCA_5284 [Clostridium scatologenes]
MKIGDILNNMKDESRPMIVAIFLYFTCFIVLLVVGVTQNFFGTDLLGTFLSSLALLILFLLAGKIFFNTDYSGLFKEIKLSKCYILDNLLITMFFSSVFALIAIFIYHVGFMINPDKTKSIGYIIETATPDDNYINSNLALLAYLITFGIAIAAEEIFFRYISYKIFVKKKGDIKIFIILTSIVFGCYHDLNLSPRFFQSIVVSIFLSIIYVMTNSVIYAFISHVLWDWSTLLVCGVFMEYFKDINTSVFTVEGIIIEIMIIFLLVLLSIYSYFKRGYVVSLNIKNKIHSIKN